nr:hypothetical protein DOPNJCKG_00012 [Escherichia coli]
MGGGVQHLHEARHRVEPASLSGTRRGELRAHHPGTLSRATPADGLQAVNIQLTGGVELVNRNQEAIRPVSTRIERSKHPANTKICAEGGQLDATRSCQSGLFAPVWGRRRIPSLRQQLDRSTRSSIPLLVAFSLCLRCGLKGQPQPFSAIDVGLDRSATGAPFDAGELQEHLRHSLGIGYAFQLQEMPVLAPVFCLPAIVAGRPGLDSRQPILTAERREARDAASHLQPLIAIHRSRGRGDSTPEQTSILEVRVIERHQQPSPDDAGRQRSV